MGVIEWVVVILTALFGGLGVFNVYKNYKLDDTKQHYYMFSVEDVNHIVYVTSKDKMDTDQLNKHRIDVGQKFKLSEELSLNIGISYIGYFSEREMSKSKSK